MGEISDFEKLKDGVRFTKYPKKYSKFVVYSAKDYVESYSLSGLIYIFVQRFGDSVIHRCQQVGKYLLVSHNLNDEQEEQLLNQCNFAKTPALIVEKGVLINF